MAGSNLVLKFDENKRHENRHFDAAYQLRSQFVATFPDREVPLEIINYHYRGACFKVPKDLDPAIFANEDLAPPISLTLGNKRLRKQLKYRVCWQDNDISRTIGIEFLDVPKGDFERANRAPVNEKYRPSVTAQDPLEPTRQIIFNVDNMSKTGLLLRTSLSNKHLFPGMMLRDASIKFPGGEPAKANLLIERVTRIAGTDEFALGVSFNSESSLLQSEMGRYLNLFVMPNAKEGLNHEMLGDALPKKLKDGLTFRIVTSAEDYQEVLMLRFGGYKKHGKVAKDSSVERQGEGLENEGQILCGYLGGRLVVSAELRLGDGPLPFRCEKIFGKEILTKLDVPKTLEINKLVVHPSLQGSDVVLGLIQKITALLLSRGGMDVLLAATNELSKFYDRIGAEMVGAPVAHPSLPGKKLNMMRIHRSVFFGDSRFSPLGFETIYRSIYDHLTALGVIPPLRRSWLSSRRLTAEAFLVRFKKRKHKRALAEKPKEQAAEVLSSVSTRWTKQHILSSVVYPYLLEAEAMVGLAKVDEIINDIGVPRRYLAKQTSWVSIEFLNEFSDRMATLVDLAELSGRAGTRGLQVDIAGANHYLLRYIATPAYCFRSFAKTAARFNKTRTYRTSHLRSNSVQVHIGFQSRVLLPKHRESCQNWASNFSYLLELLTGGPGKVEKTSCCYDGAQECTYKLAWNNARAGKKKGRVVLGAGSIALSLSLATASVFGTGAALWTLAAGLMATQWLYYSIRIKGQIAGESQALNEFEQFQAEADSRYGELESAKDELNLRLQEARLLEETVRGVQKYRNVDDLLDSSLTAFRQSFGFSRAYIMLVSSVDTLLETRAVSGVEQNLELLWKFKVNVDAKRQGHIFISSSFFSGEPILIDDVSEHFFQFNTASQEIIKALGITSFAVVPVPREALADGSGQKRWGVMIVERAADDRNVDLHDVQVLSRLAAHLGLALDKQEKINREETMRRIFQKYVPTDIVDRSLRSGQMPALGGYDKHIACMFIDLRGFTAISAELSPEEAVEYLNQFFKIVCEVSSRNDGSVDKFVGDGALITWGAVSPVGNPVTKSVTTIEDLFAALDILNLHLSQSGKPRVQFGVGLNCGHALVGNVGSEERMEFTCIGTTVNVASRLQELCKLFNADAILSAAIYERLVSEGGKLGVNWREIPGVKIRGLAGEHVVYVHEIKTPHLRIAQDEQQYRLSA